MIRTKLGSVSRQASAELLAEDERPEEGDDPQAALERLEFPVSAELLATVSCWPRVNSTPRAMICTPP